MRRLRTWFLLVAFTAGAISVFNVVVIETGCRRILHVVGDPNACQVVAQSMGPFAYLEFPDIDSVIDRYRSSLCSVGLYTGLKSLLTSSHENVRRRAAYAIAEASIACSTIGQDQVAILIKISEEDECLSVREEALIGLAKVAKHRDEIALEKNSN